VSAQVGLELSTQNLEGSTLSNTVGTDKSKHLTGSGHGETMQLEAVGAISVGDLALKVGGQVDNVDRIKRAALWANTTTDTEGLGDKSQLGVWLDFDTELSATNDGARLFALLTTFSRATLVAVHDGDTREFVGHFRDSTTDVALTVLVGVRICGKEDKRPEQNSTTECLTRARYDNTRALVEVSV
jgi:hypothetical protein